MLRYGPVLCAAVLATGPACSDPTDISECHGQVTMSAAAGPNPVFDWTPECTIGYLIVEGRADHTPAWSVSSPAGQNIIAPPVTFGVVPDGATQDHFFPLEAGGAYEVIAFIVQRDQTGDLVPVRIGEAPFNH